MRNLKKILSLALALVMVLSMMVTASAAFEDQALIDDKYAEAVEVMAELGILQGNGTDFNPNGTLTRAEAAVILSKVVSGKSDVKFFENEAAYVENPFSDVPAWAVPYVLYCYQNEIVGGVGGDKFNAKGTLRGYDFAKMLLIAAGFGVHEDYIGDATKTYETKVLEMAKKAELLNGLTITLSKNITREQASQMALNAMKAGMTIAKTWDVYVGGKLVASYPEILDAYLTAQVLKTEDIREGGTTVGGLLKEKWHVVYTPKSEDYYGRAADTYKFYDEDGELVNMLAFNTPATFKTYTNDVAATGEAAALAAGDLKNYAFANAQVKVWVDGTYTVANDTVANVVAGLTGPNTVVEVYANSSKKVTSIVATNTYFAPVTESTVSNVKYANFGGYSLKCSTSGLKAGDVVAYTKNAAGLDTYTVLVPVTAPLASYSSYMGIKTYYINNGAYTLVGQAATKAGEIEATIIEGEYVFYFGANNTVVYAHAPNVTPAAPVVNTNFAVVKETAVKWESKSVSGGLFEEDDTVVSAIAAARLVLADGKVVDVPVAIVEADKAITGTTIEAGDFYYVVDKTPYEIAPGTETLSALTGLVAYDNGVITAAKTTPATGINDNVYATTEDVIVSTTPVVDGIVLSSNTIFVIGKYNAKGQLVGYQTVKGLAALGATAENPVDPDYIVCAATWVPATATAAGYHTYTAQIVFDLDYKQTVGSSNPTATGTYVYNSMVHTVSANAEGKLVYSVAMIKSDATYVVVEMTAAEYATMTYGVYELMTEGLPVLKAAYGANTTGKVAQIVENFFTFDGTTWYQLSEKAAVAGELKVGSTIIFYETADTDTLVDYVWVLG